MDDDHVDDDDDGNDERSHKHPNTNNRKNIQKGHETHLDNALRKTSLIEIAYFWCIYSKYRHTINGRQRYPQAFAESAKDLKPMVVRRKDGSDSGGFTPVKRNE